MNIWKRLASRYSMTLVEHPYAEMLLKAMERVEPTTVQAGSQEGAEEDAIAGLTDFLRANFDE